MEGAKDCGVWADAQAESKDDRESKSGRMAESAKSLAERHAGMIALTYTEYYIGMKIVSSSATICSMQRSRL